MDEYKIKSNETVSILPLSDLHVGSGQFNEEFFEEWLKMAKRTTNKRVYCIGDMIEFASKKVGDSSFNQNISPNEQMDYVVDKLKPLRDDIIYFTPGNHCVDEDTELLTIDGFKNVHEYKGEKLATMNMDTGKLEFQKPSRIIQYYHKGLMKHLSNSQLDLLISDQHRVVYTDRNGEKDISKYTILPVSEIRNKEIFIPMSCFNDNEEYDISDEWLRLMAWCLTDSCNIDSTIVFHRGRNDLKRIIELFDDLHLGVYSYRGRKDMGCEFVINEELVDKMKYCVEHYTEVLWNVSKRQFLVFLDELVFCDGSIAEDSSWELYGSHKVLSEIQALCIKHNVRSHISKYRKVYCKLNIEPEYNGVLVENQWEDIHYEGLIWCATVPNDTLICRRNGKVAVTGNCQRASKEFNLDLAKIMADRLGVEYSSGFIDKFKVNGREFTVNGTHGNTSSARRDLSIGAIIRNTNDIDADIYLRGHNHRLLYFYNFVNTANRLKKKHYCYTGSFLNYRGSYAEKNGLNPLPAGFMVLNINRNHNVKVTETYDDLLF